MKISGGKDFFALYGNPGESARSLNRKDERMSRTG